MNMELCARQDVSANQAKTLRTCYNWPLKYHHKHKRASVSSLASGKTDTLLYRMSFFREAQRPAAPLELLGDEAALSAIAAQSEATNLGYTAE